MRSRMLSRHMSASVCRVTRPKLKPMCMNSIRGLSRALKEHSGDTMPASPAENRGSCCVLVSGPVEVGEGYRKQALGELLGEAKNQTNKKPSQSRPEVWIIVFKQWRWFRRQEEVLEKWVRIINKAPTCQDSMTIRGNRNHPKLSRQREAVKRENSRSRMQG